MASVLSRMRAAPPPVATGTGNGTSALSRMRATPPEQSWGEWATTGLLNPVADRAAESITTPRLNESPTTAKLKGFLGGAMQGASQAFTSPLDIGLAVAGGPVVRGIGKGFSALSKLVRRTAPVVEDAAGLAKSRSIKSAWGEIPEAVTPHEPLSGSRLRRVTEPNAIGPSPMKSAAVQKPKPFISNEQTPIAKQAVEQTERRAAPRTSTGLMKDLEDSVYTRMRDKAAKGEATGSPELRRDFQLKQQTDASRKAAAEARGEVELPRTRNAPESGTDVPTLGAGATTAKPRVSAKEFSTITKQRSALKDLLTEKGVTPPKGAIDKADKLGFDYRQAKASGNTDQIKTLGKQLKQHERGLIKGESGQASVSALSRLAGAGTGAAAGGATGDDTESRLRNAAIGAVAGGTLGGRFGRYIEQGEGALKSGAKTVRDLQRSSMLAGYAPLKALLGGVGSIPVTAADIAVTEGLPAAARAVRGGLRGAKQAPRAMWDAALGRTKPIGLKSDEYVNEGLLSAPGRLMATSDAGVREVLKGMGRNPKQIEDALLTGEPSTKGGKFLMRAAEDYPVLREIVTPVGLRTGIKFSEQGAKYLGGGAKFGNATAREKFGRLGIGAAAAGVGASLPDEMRSPTARGLAIAAGGPAGIPLALAEGFTAKDDRGPGVMAKGLISSALRESPLPRSVTPEAVLSRFIPRWLKSNADTPSRSTTRASRARRTRRPRRSP